MATMTRTAESTLSIGFLEEVFGDAQGTGVAFRTWDGTLWGDRRPRAIVVLNHPGALRCMLLPPSDLTLGEAYVYGDFDVEGDIEAVCTLADRLELTRGDPKRMGKLAKKLLALPAPSAERVKDRSACLKGRAHTSERDADSVRYHYDVGNEFYSHWLDDRMQYSCAYFREGSDDLDEAQLRKLEHICRKLRLRPGDRLLDVGCGWGGLATHAAAEHGAEVLGVTLSPPQAELADERIRRAGLADRVRVEVCDYRDVNGRFDKAVSVGMAEHVGRERLPEYFATVYRVLAPGGVFLNHAISSARSDRPGRKDTFIQKHVFPDGELVPVSDMLAFAEAAGFEVRDVEGLREHYAMTLRHWVRRLEERHEEAVAATDEETYRVWRLFMAGSAHFFTRGAIGVHQALLRKPAEDVRFPLTRDDWYP